MPENILNALESEILIEAYDSRPSYQQNDYVGWIISGKREEAREKRLAQMLDELRRANVYMKMSYKPKLLR